MRYRYEHFARLYLGLSVIRGTEAELLCPFHHDVRPSFRFNLSRGLWICLACGQKGNAKQLSDRLGVRLIDSAPDLRQLESDLRRANRQRGYGPPNSTQKPSEDILKSFTYHPYWSDTRKFTDHTIWRFNLGYDSVSNRLTIPIRDDRGYLLGIIYRRLDNQSPKYSHPFGLQMGNHLFGEWIPQLHHGSAALCEGPLDAVNLWNAGIPALAIYGRTLSSQQIRMMVKLGVWHVGLMFDNDEAGQLATEDAERKLIGTGILHRRIDYEGKDPGELSSKEIKRFYKWTV